MRIEDTHYGIGIWKYGAVAPVFIPDSDSPWLIQHLSVLYGFPLILHCRVQSEIRKPLISRHLLFTVVAATFLNNNNNNNKLAQLPTSINDCRSDSALQLFAALREDDGPIPRKCINRCQNREDISIRLAWRRIRFGHILTRVRAPRTLSSAQWWTLSLVGTCWCSWWWQANGRLSSWTIRFRNSIHVAVFLAGLDGEWTSRETVILKGSQGTIGCTLQEE